MTTLKKEEDKDRPINNTTDTIMRKMKFILTMLLAKKGELPHSEATPG